MSKKILVVDDERLIVKGIKFGLMQDDLKVDIAYDGEEALDKIRNNNYNLIVLDVMLPKIDGLSVCQQTRSFSNVPIIMLTAKGEDIDKIMGLEYGADDYMTKPFNILELKARIKAILRRTKEVEKVDVNENILKKSDIEIDLDSRRVSVGGKEVNLTVKEFEILHLFLSNSGKVYSRESLLDIIWGYDYPGDERTVDVHVRRLREKIEIHPSDPKYIKTKWGVGYYFKE